MQFTTGLILLTTAASIASAWTFLGYPDNDAGGNVIMSSAGNGGSVFRCLNFQSTFNDQLSSFKWDRDPEEFCEFTIYRDPLCLGPRLVTSRSVTQHTDMTPATNNMASSVLIHCY